MLILYLSLTLFYFPFQQGKVPILHFIWKVCILIFILVFMITFVHYPLQPLIRCVVHSEFENIFVFTGQIVVRCFQIKSWNLESSFKCVIYLQTFYGTVYHTVTVLFTVLFTSFFEHLFLLAKKAMYRLFGLTNG